MRWKVWGLEFTRLYQWFMRRNKLKNKGKNSEIIGGFKIKTAKHNWNSSIFWDKKSEELELKGDAGKD